MLLSHQRIASDRDFEAADFFEKKIQPLVIKAFETKWQHSAEVALGFPIQLPRV